MLDINLEYLHRHTNSGERSCCFTIDDLYVPAALGALWYDCKCVRSSIWTSIFIKSSDVNGFSVGTQTAVGAGQGGTVVIGVCDLDADGSCGCC